jgi:hypothetical protein
MVGTFLDLCTAQELRRIIDAPLEDWCTIEPINDRGQRCLLGHACDLGHRDELTTHLWMSFTHNGRWKNDPEDVGQNFDALVHRFSLPRVVRAIKIRALQKLTDMRPSFPAFARDV